MPYYSKELGGAGGGEDGKDASVKIDSVETVGAGKDAEVENKGDKHDAKLKFKIPQGEEGEPGESGDNGNAATVKVDSTETVDEDQDADVSNEGDKHDAKLKFKIPQGKRGRRGKKGDTFTYDDMSDDNLDDLAKKIADKLKDDNDFVEDVADKVDEEDEEE